MARGYPTREEDPVPTVGAVVPEGVCPICKRRPLAEGKTACARCDAILSG